MAAKKQTLEQALLKLEDILEKMRDEATSLDENVKLYKKGIELAAFCGERLDGIEKEVTLLRERADGSFTQESFV